MEQKSSIKVCFLLQRRFAYVGHRLAIILKEKYGINRFCAFVSQRSSFEFLKKQKDINYTSLLLDEDIHENYKNEVIDWEYLGKIEKEYGVPNLWPYIAIDRVVMSNQLVREYPYDKSPYAYEEMVKIFQVKAKAIINFFEKEKPNVVFSTVVASISSMLLYYVAKKKGVKFLLSDSTRIKGGCTLTEDYKRYTYVEKEFNELMAKRKKSQKTQEAREFLKEFRSEPTTFLYYSPNELNKSFRLQPLKWLSPKSVWRTINWFFKLTANYLAGKKRDYTDEKPLGSLIDKIKRKVRTAAGLKGLYNEVNLDENFVFFPLHYEPELSLSLFAPFWQNQINLVRQMSVSLPLNFKLYVKEHPGMVGYRTRSYYKELKKNPNVKLVNPIVPSYDLIKKARLVLSISGTIGWEAVLLKKPVITFGDVFYNKLSFVKKCEKIEELPYLVKSQLENFNYNEEELELFVAAMLEESADVGLLRIWEKGDESEETKKKKLTLLADLIARKISLKPINC